jgi:hypothetical protein
MGRGVEGFTDTGKPCAALIVDRMRFLPGAAGRQCHREVRKLCIGAVIPDQTRDTDTAMPLTLATGNIHLVKPQDGLQVGENERPIFRHISNVDLCACRATPCRMGLYRALFAYYIKSYEAIHVQNTGGGGCQVGTCYA